MDHFSGGRLKARYFMIMGLFTSSMVALVAAADLWGLFLLWSWIGIGSYLLIAHNYRKTTDARAAARAFMVSKVGEIGLMMLLLMMSVALPRLDFTSMRAYFGGHQLVLSVWVFGACCMWAAMSKSAQLLFQPWLLAAMRGPLPVSALLHSATLVIAGVLLLGRMSFLLTDELRELLLLLSLSGAGWAAVAAMRAAHVKRLLAYSTISHVGLMMVMVALGQTDYALMYIVVHGVAKALLFMATGQITRQMELNLGASTSEEVRHLGRLRLWLPLPYLACGSALMVLIGAPFGAAYGLKHLLWAEAYAHARWSGALLMVVLLCTAVYVARLAGYLFSGPAMPTTGHWYRRLWVQRSTQQLPLWVCSIGCWAVCYEYPRVGVASWFEYVMSNGLYVSTAPTVHAFSSSTMLLGLPIALSVTLVALWPRHLAQIDERLMVRLHHTTYLERSYGWGWRIVQQIATQVGRFEHSFLDRWVRIVVRGSLLIALFGYFIDRRVVDGASMGGARLLRWLGHRMSRWAEQHLPLRMTKVFGLLFLLMVIVYLFLI